MNDVRGESTTQWPIAAVMGGPKTALLKGVFKELLRTLKDDSAYLAQADQLQATTGAAAVAWGVQPDAYARSFARLQGLIAEGDVRSLWSMGKLRAKERLREACAAVGRRYEEATRSGQQQQEPLWKQQGADTVVAGADEQQLKELYGEDGWARAAVMYTLAHLGRTWMTQLNSTHVQGSEHLAAALAREPGRPLITVSNHVASIDDPLVMSAVLPPEAFSTPEQLRWTLCASDRCFHRAALVPFFRAAKVLPVERGAGMFQPGLAAAEARLRAGDWVHIFPEGTRSKDGSRIGPARKGVGRLVAACAERGAGGGPAPLPPLVVPFVHSGMHEVMPRGALLPRTGKDVRVLVGEPVEVADLLEAARRDAWPEDELYKRIAARVGLSLQSLKARLDGSPLGAGALSALEAEQARASALDLYDPRDRHANKRPGWRGGGAARWVQSVGERLEFNATHRAWAASGVTAAALEGITGARAPSAAGWLGGAGAGAGLAAGAGWASSWAAVGPLHGYVA